MLRLVLALCFFAAFSAVSAPVYSTTPAAAAKDPSPVAVTTHYAFYSNPWLNLHHFLYQWACVERAERHPCKRRYDVPERADLDRLTPEERRTWEKALRFYADSLLDRSLLFDAEMRAVKHALRSVEDADSDVLDTLPLGVGPSLTGAMSVYRAHWWSEHDAANRRWIDAMVARLRPIEAALVDRMVRAYGTTWPDKQLAVDVAPYATWQGAYTTIRPTHITIAWRLSEAGSDGAVETLVHETAHDGAFTGPLLAALRESFAAVDAEPPGELWHVMIFYLSGEITRWVAAEDPATYEHYAARRGLYDRAPWSAWIPAIQRHGAPFVEGTADRATAFARIARDIAAGAK